MRLVNSFEGGTNTTAISAANSGAASGNAFDAIVGTAPTFSSTHASHGLLGMAPVTTAQSMVSWTTSIGTPTELWSRCYIFITAAASTNMPFIYYRDSGNAANLSGVRVNTGALTIGISANAFTNAVNFTNALTASSWARVELHSLISGGNLTCDGRLFLTPDSNTPTETQTTTQTTTATSFGAIRFGSNLAQTTTVWYDDVGVDTTGWMGQAMTPLQWRRSMTPVHMAAGFR